MKVTILSVCCCLVLFSVVSVSVWVFGIVFSCFCLWICGCLALFSVVSVCGCVVVCCCFQLCLFVCVCGSLVLFSAVSVCGCHHHHHHHLKVCYCPYYSQEHRCMTMYVWEEGLCETTWEQYCLKFSLENRDRRQLSGVLWKLIPCRWTRMWKRPFSEFCPNYVVVWYCFQYCLFVSVWVFGVVFSCVCLWVCGSLVLFSVVSVRGCVGVCYCFQMCLWVCGSLVLFSVV